MGDSNEDPGEYVPARLVGPNDAAIMEQAHIIQDDFQAAIDRLVRKKKERPKEKISDLYWEEPFHSDAIAVQQRLFEEDRIALQGKKLEHDFEVKGLGIPVVTVDEERRMIAAIEKKNAREAERKRKLVAWNPDQPGASTSAMRPTASATRTHPQSAFKLIEDSSSGCTSCAGPCAFDSRRSIMTCTNEPMFPELFADLLAQFYRMKWMLGSGGAMAAMTCDNRLLLSPSSLQKERIKPCDLFASSPNSLVVKAPVCNPHGKPTACEGIFKLIMQQTGAQCVIHSHSKASNLATRLLKVNGKEWAMSGQEYIKGIYNFATHTQMDNEDVLFVPIIENMPTEEELEPQVRAVLNNPNFNHISAILVRSHGVFVWGPTWQKTKIMAEIYEYLFDLSIDLSKAGIPPVRHEDLARACTLGRLANQIPINPADAAIIHATNPALLVVPPAPMIPEEPTSPSAPPPE